MWSWIFDGETEDIKEGSGFTLNFFVVRREVDSCLRDSWDRGMKADGSKKGRVVTGRRGTIVFILCSSHS